MIETMKFVADCMLGKLAKWLRVLGFDTVYLNKAEDRDLLLLARRQKRVLLTKDHGLLEAAADVRSLFIESDNWPEQVVQVLETFRLGRAVRPHSRCLACNVRLKPISKRAAGNLVSPFVLERAASFAVCPSCQRVYWPGTHFRDMDATVERIMRKSGGRSESGGRKKEKSHRRSKKS